MRYLKDSEQSRPGKAVWKHGRKGGRAVCPLCRQEIRSGSWVRRAPGIGGVVRHAYRCPSRGVRS